MSTIIDKEKTDNRTTQTETPEEQLARKSAELEAAKKSLETISYTISHDLRAPLRTIDSFSQALVEDFGSQLPEDAQDYLHRIRKASAHMKGMIEELLELARVNRRKMEYQEINFSGLIHDIAEDLTLKDPGRKIEFVIEDNMRASGDRYLLKIAMQHLLHNAWKFTQAQPEATINVRCLNNGEKTTYVIEDNGVGFDLNFADQVFEPFKRLHPEKQYAGMGVGLTVAKLIIERHEGEIWLESEPSTGTQAYFTLGHRRS